MDPATTTAVLINAYATAHPWKFAFFALFVVLMTRELIGFFLHTGTIKDELREIKRLLEKK